jgi:hypothetical protein
MDTWERFGLSPEEYETCVRAAEELRALAEGGAPSADDLARDWGAAKATHRRLAIPTLWKALGFEAVPLVRRLVPQGPEDWPSRA